MNDLMIILIPAAVGLFLFWAIYKVLKAVVFALLVALFVGGALFFYLPRMEPTTGELEVVRQKAVHVTDALKNHSQEISDNIHTVSESLGDVATQAEQLLNSLDETNQAIKNIQDGTKKEGEAQTTVPKTNPSTQTPGALQNLKADDLKDLNQGIQKLQELSGSVPLP
jgi:methyl-accepting chemotaxis protein